ncbi:MerR family transcriptional regulator [Nocardioidaceae bacterium]|nr:MerR family transcriptional regulator [Nocardioidaceae bacterium]
MAEPSTEPASAGELTIDELAQVTGVTVRTTRYYASRGLLPQPVRRGRVAFYTAEHRARLELVRALQDHGFTLAAIERHLSSIPLEASVEELMLQRTMLTSWSPVPRTVLTREALEAEVGRPLAEEELDRLVLTGAVSETGGGWAPTPGFEVGVQMLELDIPTESLVEAATAINRHMDALADELTEIVRERVLRPRRAGAGDARTTEATYARLREITLAAVVSGFQRAADEVITRSLAR